MNEDRSNSPEEMLDVVNEQDEVVGTATRRDVHDKFLIHRGIEVWLYDDKNRLLLQQRSAKKRQNPLNWTRSVGGHVTAGMHPDDAATKELEEELGFVVPLTFVRKQFSKTKRSMRFRYVYVGKYQGQEIKINPDEVEQVKFVTKEEFEDMLAEGVEFSKSSIQTMMQFWQGKLT